MIPLFPLFKPLERSDQKYISNITSHFLPYSDYNFTSLYCWNTQNTIEISILNSNLVIRFDDYITNEPFYSFLGINTIVETVDILLNKARDNNFLPYLKLIPEEVIESNNLISKHYIIEEDQDNFDYILDIEELLNLKGTKFLQKRNYINRFNRDNSDVLIELLPLEDHLTQDLILGLFDTWVRHKKKEIIETENERLAIKRLFDLSDNNNIFCIGLFKHSQLIGFSIEEILHHNWALSHFEKADTSYKGIFEFLKNTSAKHLFEKKCTRFNIEQDLGIVGLRKAKEDYNPVGYLKKYIIKNK